MSDLKVQAEVAMSTEGAESALDRVADKAGQMASRLQAEGAKAGKAVDGIGEGADKSAEQFSRAEGRMSESIKRATKNLQELGKTASQKIELRIAERNLDPARFEPMLVKLRELEAAQVRVATGSTRAGGGLQNFSYQLQDMVVQVNGGTDAMRAMSMQLPQMLIGFGAAGAAIGVVAALLPNMISAFGGAGEGTKKFSDAMSDFDKAVGDVGSTVKKFDLNPLYEQFNDSSAAVRAATIEQIKFQQEYLRTTQLVAKKSFAKSLSGVGEYTAKGGGISQSEKMVDQFGLYGVKNIDDIASDLFNSLRRVRDEAADAGPVFEKFGVLLLSGNEASVALAKSLSDMAKSEREAAAAAAAGATAQEKMTAAGDKDKIAIEGKAKAAKAAKAEVDALDALLNGITAKDVGLDANYVKNVETLINGWSREKLTLEEFNAVFARYAAMQPGVVAAEQERAKALDAAWKAEQERAKALDAAWKAEVKLIEEMGKETASLEKQVAQAQLENEQIGLTKEQLNALKLSRLDDAIATKEQALAYAQKHSKGAAEIELIREQVDALKELRAVTASSQVRQANADALKEQADAWKKFGDDIERSLTDSLFRAFESGESFGKAFAQSLQNTFKTMVLKFGVQAVVTTGSGALSNALGMGSTLQMGSSAYNLAMPGNLYSSFATSSLGSSLGLSTPFVDTLGGVGTMGAQAGGTALTTLGSALPYVAAALAIASMFSKESTPHAGGIAFGRASGISTPVGRDAIGGFYADPAQALSLGMMRSDWASRNDAAMSAQLGTVAKGFADTLDNILKANSQGSGYQVGLAFSADGEDPARGHATITDAQGNIISSYKDKNDLGKDASKAMEKLVGTELPQMLLSALEKLDLNGLADSYLDSLNIESLSADAAQQALAFVDASDNLIAAFVNLGIGANNVTAELIGALGGLDSAMAGLDSYYQGYFTEAERVANATAGLSAQFSGLGLAMPATRDEFRGLVESLDLTSEAGRSAYATLIGLSGAFGTVADFATKSATQAIEQAQAASNDYFYQDGQRYRAVAPVISSSAQSISDSWQSIANGLLDTARKLRGDLLGEEQSYARSLADFTIATASARGGDQDAAGRLSDLADQVIGAARFVSGTSSEYELIAARTAASISTTAEVLSSGRMSDYLTLSGKYSGGGQIDTAALISALDRLESRLVAIESHTQATASATNGDQRAPILVEVA